MTTNYKPTTTKRAIQGVKQSFSGKDIYFTLDHVPSKGKEYYVLVYEMVSLNKEESFKKVFYADSILQLSDQKSPEYDYSTSFYDSWVFRSLVKRALKQKMIPEWKGFTFIEGTYSFIPLWEPELLKSFACTRGGIEYVTFLYYSSQEKVYAFESIIKKNNNIQTQDETSGGIHESLKGLIPLLGDVNPITLCAIPSELDVITYIKSLEDT